MKLYEQLRLEAFNQSCTRNVCSSGISLIPFRVSIFASSYGYGTVSHPGIASFGSLSIATSRSGINLKLFDQVLQWA